MPPQPIRRPPHYDQQARSGPRFDRKDQDAVVDSFAYSLVP